MNITKTIQDIKDLKIQGAREIAKTGIKCIRFLAQQSKKNRRDFLKEIKKLSEKLVRARPTEPALRNFIQYILFKAEHYEGKNLKKYIIALCDQYLNELDDALRKIAEIGAEQISSGETILTHCHSHSVVEIFRKAKREGKDFTVIVTETRPKNQGLLTAKDLLKSKVKVIFCVDSAVGYVMKDVDKVLVGCDAILADGSVVNKIGTLPIAIVAERFGVPFFVSAGTYKFDPLTIKGFQEPIEKRDPKEIINPKKLPGARIINPAFDIIPCDYIRALITEKGIVRPELVRRFTDIYPPVEI